MKHASDANKIIALNFRIFHIRKQIDTHFNHEQITS